MIVHCTSKLAKKIPVISPVPLKDIGLLGSWHANLYVIGHRQCVLFCHDLTRYVLFLPGLRKADFVRLGSLHRELFLSTLRYFGIDEGLLKKAEKGLGQEDFDTATDRSVLGSMQVARSDLEAPLFRAGGMMNQDPVKVSCEVSHRPASVKGAWIWPDQMMIELVEKI